MHVARWGNSLAVRIPSAIVEALDLKPGDEIEIRVAEDRVFEISRDNRKQVALATLQRLRKPLPQGFRFDRDEVHER